MSNLHHRELNDGDSAIMKPLVKWSGGKRNEITQFEQHFPKDFERYIEPFVGGGAVFFHLSPNQGVISDASPELTNFYAQVAQGNGKQIHALMQAHQNDEKVFYFVRDQFQSKNDIERAFRFFYLRKTCYRGMLRHNSKGKFNVPFGRYKTFNFDELIDEEYHKLLSKTIILNESFESVFDKFEDKNNFVFLDPPYDSEFSDYGSKFGKIEHQKLAELFKTTKNKCLLVIGETDFIKGMYSDYIVGQYSKKYAFKLHSGRIGSEIDNNHLIVRNY